jgi:hypothetical protein
MRHHAAYSLAFRGLLSLTLAALAFGVFHNLQRARAQGQVVEGSSVVLQEVVTKTDGTASLSALYKYATRGDGSAAFSWTSNPSDVQAPLRIVRLASGVQGYLSDARRQKCMTPLTAEANPAAPRNIRTASSRCSLAAGNYKESALAEERISGYRAEKVLAGNHTAWYALDYGCALVKEHFDWGNGAMSDKYLILLRPGEPEDALFSVPPGYADVPASAFAHGG